MRSTKAAYSSVDNANSTITNNFGKKPSSGSVELASSSHHSSSNDDSDQLLHSVLSIDEAIEKVGYGRFQRLILIAAGLCFSADAMEILLLSFLTIVLKYQWELSEEQTSSLTFSVFAGALFGSMILGPLGDWVGRRPVFFIAALIITIFGMLTAVAESYAALVFMRFIVGFGVGGLTVPFDTLAEFLPTDHRGKNLLVIEYFWTGGSLLVLLFAYLTLGDSPDDEDSWQLFVVLCALPCAASCVMGFMVVPESPRWLCSRGRPTEALLILKKAARVNGLDPDILFPAGTILTAGEEDHSNICDLFAPEWVWITLRLWGAWAGFAFCYYGTILSVTLVFSDQHGNKSKQGYDFDYAAIFASSFAEVVGLSIVILTVDKWGRIPSQTVSYLLGGVGVFLLCLFADMGAPRGGLVVCSFFARLFMMSGTCSTWVSTSEILTTEVRSTGHSAANAIARIGGSLSPYLVTESTPLLNIGIVILCLSLATARFVSKLPETAGVAIGAVAPHLHPVETISKEEKNSSASTYANREIL